MSRINEILFYVDKDCVVDFNTVLADEGVEVSQMLLFSPTGFEKFAIHTESILPKLKMVAEVLKKLVILHKKSVSFEAKNNDGSSLKADVTAGNADEVMKLLKAVEDIYITVKNSERQ
ncbi:hypothetical protein [Serratia ureilytica]|uniref:hypothetical protein n=1 Tax=Serratia ureilytica TaxID=300181 RepID=UPI00235EBEAB|nr:hypothetical protein [Serratia ureilytica]